MPPSNRFPWLLVSAATQYGFRVYYVATGKVLQTLLQTLKRLFLKKRSFERQYHSYAVLTLNLLMNE